RKPAPRAPPRLLPRHLTTRPTDAMNVLSAPALPHGLPPLSQELKKHVGQVNDYLLDRIEDEGGFLPFDQWMHYALYAPHLGYYTGDITQFGSNQPTGDFTTAS